MIPKHDLDRKQLMNLIYFAIGSFAAVLAAFFTDHPFLNGWFFASVTVFCLAMFAAASLSCSRATAHKVLESSYVLPIAVCRLLRATALLLPLLAILTSSFYVHEMCTTSLFISRLEQLYNERRPADARAEITSWISKHRDSGYSWYKLARFYQRNGQYDLALSAAEEHVRLHGWETCAINQRNEIRALLDHKSMQSIPSKKSLENRLIEPPLF